MKSFWIFWNWFKANWHSNVIATAAIVLSAQQFTAAVIAWENNQPVNWKTAVVSLLVAAVGYVVKDSSTHSTQTEINVASRAAKND